MMMSKMKTSFLKNLSRATLILLLPMSVGMTLPAEAAAQSKAMAKDPHLVKLDFQESKSIADVLKTYPFLQKDLADVQATDEGSEDKTQILISDMRSDKRKLNLLFMRLQGSNWCGSAGCTLNVYADDGSGYKKALDAVVDEPIYLASKTGGKLSLVFCTAKGRTEWDFKKNAFTFKGPYTGKNKPSCE